MSRRPDATWSAGAADPHCRKLRGGRVTSALIGASSPEQLEDNVAAVRNLDFDADELARIEAVIKR